MENKIVIFINARIVKMLPTGECDGVPLYKISQVMEANVGSIEELKVKFGKFLDKEIKNASC